MIDLAVAQGWLADVSRVATGGLVSAVWQGLLLAAAVGLGLRRLPKTPAAVRFAIWFAVFLVVTGLPVVSLWPHSAGPMQAGGRGAWLTLDSRWSVAIAVIWAAASLVRAGTLVGAAFRVRTLWKRAKPVDFEGASGLHPTHRDTAPMDGAPGVLSVTRRAKICTSDEVDRPTVIGFFAPKILIPTWLLEKLTAAEFEQIVLHEAGHLGRADDWMNLLQKVALVVFPLNPALAWVERRLCFERELACDERVLRVTRAPKAYAACLATLAEHRLGRRGLALALGALGRESELGRRVRRILRRGETMRPLHSKLVLGGAMLGLLGGAVGLERCPQVVGFAAAPEQSAALVAPGRVRAAGGLGYKAVMFHPNPANNTLVNSELEKNTDVSDDSLPRTSGNELASSADEPGTGSRRLKPQVENSAYGMAKTMPLSKTDVSESRSSRLEPVVQRPVERTTTRTVQWVVVTAWQGDDGSRLVFATTERTSGPPKVLSDTPAEPGEAGALQEQEQPSEQVHPYAAVPVRGGWLVFQL